LFVAALGSAIGRPFRVMSRGPISNRSSLPAEEARTVRRVGGVVIGLRIVHHRPRPYQRAARSNASAPSSSNAPPTNAPDLPSPPWSARRRHRSAPVPRQAADRSRRSASNHVPPCRGHPVPTLASASPAPIARGDQMLRYHCGADRHSQRGEQPERLRRPHGNPAAQHPRASDHVVHPHPLARAVTTLVGPCGHHTL
jgi:hypothetical protein